MFKEGNKPPRAGKKEASRTTVTRVSVNGSRMRKSFINAPENRYRYCAFSILRNKIDLLHPFMNKKDELFAASVKGLRHRRQSKSFSRAGEMIGLSQSAVSHSVKELEHQTGVRLLDRTTREVVLTEAGQQLAGRLSGCWMN
jgi:hypothetical protein